MIRTVKELKKALEDFNDEDEIRIESFSACHEDQVIRDLFFDEATSCVLIGNDEDAS